MEHPLDNGSTECRLDWYALHIFRNGRKSVEAALFRDDVECYRPVRVEIELSKGGVETRRSVPVLPSLLFVRCPAEYVESIQHDPESLAYPYVTPGTKDPAPIPDDEMAVFRFALEHGGDRVDLYEGRFEKGDRVRVIDGVMKGTEGYVVRVRGSRRFVVAIEGVVAVATAYIPGRMLERIEPEGEES